MGFKEDKKIFEEKILDRDLSKQQRIANVDEVNPFFFKKHLKYFAEDYDLMAAILRKMRPSWIAEYILAEDAVYHTGVLEEALDQEKFSQAEIFDFIQADKSELMAVLMPYVTDQESLKYIVLNAEDMFATEALKRLEEPLTEEEYRRSENPSVIYHGIEQGILKDFDYLLPKLIKSKSVMSDPAKVTLIFDNIKDLEEDEAAHFISIMLSKHGDEIGEMIIDKVDNMDILITAVQEKRVLRDNLMYMINKYKDEEFTYQLANHIRYFRDLAPMLGDDTYRKLWEENEEQRKGYAQYLSPELVDEFLREFDKWDKSTQYGLLDAFFTNRDADSYDQDLLNKLFQESDDYHVMSKIVNASTDVDWLEKIALDDTLTFELRQDALNGLQEIGSDYKDVVEVILEDAKPTEDLGQRALIDFTLNKHYLKMKDLDQNILKKIIEIDPGTATYVMKHITDTEYLKKLVMEEEGLVASFALQRLTFLLDDNETADFLPKPMLEAKDKDLRPAIYKMWARDHLADNIQVGKKAIEQNPKLAAWTLQKLDKDKLPEDFVKFLSEIKPRVYDEAKGDGFKKLDDKVPAHKQQLLRLLLTIAIPS